MSRLYVRLCCVSIMSHGIVTKPILLNILIYQDIFSALVIIIPDRLQALYSFLQAARRLTCPSGLKPVCMQASGGVCLSCHTSYESLGVFLVSIKCFQSSKLISNPTFKNQMNSTFKNQMKTSSIPISPGMTHTSNYQSNQSPAWIMLQS